MSINGNFTIAIGLALVSVTLTAAAQLLLKMGVARVLAAVPDKATGIADLVLAVAVSPAVIVGLLCFGVSVLTWLTVLARMDVSQAYPFVSLGIVLTIFGGHYLLGEQISLLRIIGGCVIVLGVLLVSAS